ncbi:MAG: chorismate-binding protein [Flavobacteriales bacterium]
MKNAKKLAFNCSKAQVLHWAQAFDYYCFFDSNGYKSGFGLDQFDWMLGVSSVENSFSSRTIPEQLELNHSDLPLFFHLTYEAKNTLEPLLKSKNKASHTLDCYRQMQPDFVLFSKNKQLFLIGDEKQIEGLEQSKALEIEPFDQKLEFQSTKSDYFKAFESCQKALQAGEIYEINLCQEVVIRDLDSSPESIFHHLNTSSKAPFSALMKWKNYSILSASPERFLCRENNILFSQPIKGTRPRSKDQTKDLELKTELKTSLKERAENTMIVDLVRNDLSKYAKKGSVVVDKLCEINSYPHVHQMSSEIRCELKSDHLFWKALLEAFPMGSMTGIPKFRCMELTDDIEKFSRGSYSGTLGFHFPGFSDSNVLIRSLFYDVDRQFANTAVGGAITIRSKAEEEYQECLDKLRGIRKMMDD